MAKLKDTQIDGNLYVSEDIQIGDISVTDRIDELNDAYYNNPSYSNPNLLINGDFQVNQRGFTTITNSTSNKYLVDRWLHAWGTATITKVTNGMTIQNSHTGGTPIEQRIECNVNQMIGKEMTLSASVNGVVYSSTNILSETETIFETSDFGMYFRVDTSRNCITVRIYPLVGKTITVNWVKLEQGSVATPFIPRLYAEELALCQRYFIDYKPLDHTGLMGSGGDRIYIPMQIFTNMRTIPTVVHNITTITMYYNGTYNSGIAVSGVSANADYELVFSTTAVSSIKSCAVAFFWARGSKLQFDAEIY